MHTPGLRYGPWLEGTSRRNARSSFKGYRLYDDARREAAARAGSVAGEVIADAVKEISG